MRFFPSIGLHRARRHAPEARAFTLVELLVVIGIIALLISILMPTLAAARKQARTLKCLSNLRQLGMAFTMYINENRGKSPFYTGFLPGSNTDPHDWIALLRPSYSGVDYVRFCPEADEDTAAPEPTTSEVDFGTATIAWRATWPSPANGGALTSFAGSYCFNGYLFQDTMRATGNFQSTWGIPLTNLIKLPAKESDRVPLIADGMWFNTWPFESDPAPSNIQNGDPSLSDFMGRVCINRHPKKKTNVVFLDGHAATIGLQDLWTLKWHENWVTPSPLPNP